MLRQLSSFFQLRELDKKWIKALLFVFPSAISIGILVAQGRDKIVLFIFGVSLFFIVMSLSSQIKYWLFLAGIFLGLITPVDFPLGISLGELILTALVVDQLFTNQRGSRSLHMPNSSLKPLPFIIAFAGYSLIINLIHKDLIYWHVVSLIPLLCLVLSMTMVNTPKRAWMVIKIALFVIISYLILWLLANLTGRVTVDFGADWRLGGQTFSFGPLVFTMYSVHLAGFIGLGIPALIILMLSPSEKPFFRLFYGSMLVIFTFALFITAARGPLIGMILSIILTLILIFRLRWLMIAAILVIVIILLFTLPLIAQAIPQEILVPVLNRYSELQDINSVGTFGYRLKIFDLTLQDIGKNPFGSGYNYLYLQYGYGDEANIYTSIINGSGILGFVLFVLILGILAWKFIDSYRKANIVWQRDFAVIGLSTLVFELISGVSAHNVVVLVKDSVVFWSILAACYSILQYNPPMREKDVE